MYMYCGHVARKQAKLSSAATQLRFLLEFRAWGLRVKGLLVAQKT